MEKLLTVVIPTYNMELYLNRCLDSLLIDDSIMKMLEVLVINDGSKDSSSAIAHTYETNYPNVFRVIDKENGNYGSCINRGIEEATGLYLKVLDADDWYDSAELRKLLEQISANRNNKVDVFYSNFTYHNVNKDIVNPYRFSTIEYNRFYNLADVNFVNTTDWFMLKMYSVTIRTEILRAINLRLDTGISYTDNEYMYFPFSHIGKVMFLDINVYQYFIGREGQTINARVTAKHLDNVFVIAKREVDDYLTNIATVINNNTKLAMTLMVAERCVAYFDQALGFYDKSVVKTNINILHKAIKTNKELLEQVTKKSKAYMLWRYTRIYKSNPLIMIFTKM